MYTKKLKSVPVVYFVSDGNGFIKIGYASDIYQRFTTMQVNNAAELSIVHLVYSDDLDDIHWLEKAYHKDLKPYKVRGEWYEETPVLEYLTVEENEMAKLGLTQDFEEEQKIFLEMGKLFNEFAKFDTNVTECHK